MKLFNQLEFIKSVTFYLLWLRLKTSLKLHSVRRLSSNVVSQTTKVFTFSTSLVGFYLLISVKNGQGCIKIDSLT